MDEWMDLQSKQKSFVLYVWLDVATYLYNDEPVNENTFPHNHGMCVNNNDRNGGYACEHNFYDDYDENGQNQRFLVKNLKT